MLSLNCYCRVSGNCSLSANNIYNILYNILYKVKIITNNEEKIGLTTNTFKIR